MSLSNLLADFDMQFWYMRNQSLALGMSPLSIKVLAIKQISN